MNRSLSPSEKLKIAIESLEEKKRVQEEDLKIDISGLMESLKPRNLIKSAIHDVISNPRGRRAAVTAGIGAAAVGVTRNFVKKKLTTAASKILSSGFHFISKKLKRKK